MSCASHALVIATVAVRTVLIPYFGVAITKGGGGIQKCAPQNFKRWGAPGGSKVGCVGLIQNTPPLKNEACSAVCPYARSPWSVPSSLQHDPPLVLCDVYADQQHMTDESLQPLHRRYERGHRSGCAASLLLSHLSRPSQSCHGCRACFSVISLAPELLLTTQHPQGWGVWGGVPHHSPTHPRTHSPLQRLVQFFASASSVQLIGSCLLLFYTAILVLL